MFRFRSNLILALLFSLAIASFSRGQTQQSLKYRLLIPEGYVGWIRVDFEVPDAPPLPVEGGYYIFKFSDTGRIQTSSRDLLESWDEQFLYYSTERPYLLKLKVGGPPETIMVHGHFSGPGPGHNYPVPHRYRYYFIGPRDVFDRVEASDPRTAPQEPDGYPKVGSRSVLTREDLIRMKIRKP
jgi:uncharacterized protein DUF6843